MKDLFLDAGSTFIKYAFRDRADGRIEPQPSVPFPAPVLDDGARYEVAEPSIRSVILGILEEARAHGCTSAFISVQMHGHLLRSPDGVFSNYVSWKDRSGDIGHPLLKAVDFAERGTSRKPNLPLARLCNDKESLSGTEFFTLGSYIAYLLTGRNVTHSTDGCASGLFHAQTLLPLSPFDGMCLPEVLRRVEPIGACGEITVYAPMGDHQISFLGSGAGEDDLLLNIGTATQLSTLGSAASCPPSAEARPWFDERRLLTVTNLTRGEQLFAGYSPALFTEEIIASLDRLPPKKRMLLGGGGARLAYDSLAGALAPRGVECILIQENIGFEGLAMIADKTHMQLGTMLSEVCFQNYPIILKNCGYDFFIIDNEHGAFDYSFLSAVVTTSRLTGMPAILRLPDASRKDITKFCDMGVQGFLLPMTNTADDIREVVKYARYAPDGSRGVSTNRAHTLYNPPSLKEYMKTANREMKIYAQIETKAGCENIDEILAVPGVDGVFIGPNDLSVDLNCVGDNGPVKEAIAHISRRVQAAGKVWGIITANADLIGHSRACGVNMLSCGSELNMLQNSLKKIRRDYNG